MRIHHVGRLDKDSNGLILLTNDGDIINEILRAENKHEKEYIVAVELSQLHQSLSKNMSEGVKIFRHKNASLVEVTAVWISSFKLF